jgi:hypothetical protein
MKSCWSVCIITRWSLKGTWPEIVAQSRIELPAKDFSIYECHFKALKDSPIVHPLTHLLCAYRTYA